MNNQILLTPDFTNKLPVSKSTSSDTQHKPSPLEAADQQKRQFKDDMDRADKQADDKTNQRSENSSTKEDSSQAHNTRSKQSPEEGNTEPKDHHKGSGDGEAIAENKESNSPHIDNPDTLSQLETIHVTTHNSQNSTDPAVEATLLPTNIKLNHHGEIITEVTDSLIPGDIKQLQATEPDGSHVIQTQQNEESIIIANNPAVTTTAAVQVNAQTATETQLAATHIPSAVKMVEKLVLEKTPVPASGWLANKSAIAETANATQALENTTPAVAMAPATSPAATTAGATPVSQLSLTTPVNQPQWGEAVAEKVMWMSAKGIKEAEIQLDPPELGPLSVKVTMSQEQAQVSFTVQHTSVRDALDQSAMRLREMFAEDGINLADVDVSEHSQSEQQDAENEQFLTDTDNDEHTEVVETPVNSNSTSYNLIDSYVY